jgi:hypothetical protein
VSRKKLRTIEKHALDLNNVQFETRKHGIIVLGSWVRVDNRWQPCLVLLHGSRPVARNKTMPIVIPLSESWRWALHGEVGDPAHCVQKIIEWLHYGWLPGNPANKNDHIKIMDAINTRLPDLIAMPPKPKGELYTIGEAIIRNVTSGEAIAHREIQNDA